MRKFRLSGLSLWLASATAFVCFAGGFNVAIDPFGYFDTNRIGYYFSSEREFKSNLVRQNGYNALIMGDSRIAFTDPKYIKRLDYSFMNAGFASANLPEMYEILQGADLSQLKLLVLGLRYVDLKHCRVDAEKAWSIWDPFRYALNWSQLGYSIQALQARFDGQVPNYHQDGTRASEEKMLRDVALDGQKNEKYWSKVLSSRDSWKNDAKFADRCLRILQQMKDLSSTYGFELVLILLPYNSDMIGDADWDGWVRATERQAEFARLRRIIPNFVDFSNSRFSNSKNFWVHDANHFLPNVGASIVEQGVLLSRDRHVVSQHQ